MSDVLNAFTAFFDHLRAISWLPVLLALACHLAKIGARTRVWRNILAAAYPATRVRWRRVRGAWRRGALLLPPCVPRPREPPQRAPRAGDGEPLDDRAADTGRDRHRPGPDRVRAARPGLAQRAPQPERRDEGEPLRAQRGARRRGD